MARIAGIELPRNKKIGVGLTYIYGIGRVTALKIRMMRSQIFGGLSIKTTVSRET